MATGSEETYPGVADITDPMKAYMLHKVFMQVWSRIAQLTKQAKGPILGTLNPDTKPILTPNDVGARFFATDYNRTYQWTGSGWIDAPDAPPRFQVSYFAASPEPQVGLVRCNGAAVNRSTADGRTVYYQVPNIPDSNGQAAWVRV